MSAEDAEALSALIQRTVRRVNSADYEPVIIDLICDNFTASKILAKMQVRDMFAYVRGGRLVGTISLGGRRLHSLFVDPDEQRKGIGARLVTHLEQHALGKDVDQLELSSSITARDFYIVQNYRQIAFEQRPDGSTYLMRKQLTRS